MDQIAAAAMKEHNHRDAARPQWFEAALSEPCEEITIDVSGCPLEVLCWGHRGKPGVLLLHGSRAHARWWIAVGPLLARDFRICALSFSGMGGSGRRKHYSVRQMAEEAWEAAEAGGVFAGPVRPIVAAHSFGGHAAAIMAGERGGELSGTMLIDSFVLPGASVRDAPNLQPRYYPTQADGITRFRFTPEQPGEPAVVEAIARAALREDSPGRWTWRFDPDCFRRLDYVNGWDQLVAARCRLALLRGQHSAVVSEADEAVQRQALRSDSIFVNIPDAHHHIMVDQPLALVAAMRAIAATWLALPGSWIR